MRTSDYAPRLALLEFREAFAMSLPEESPAEFAQRLNLPFGENLRLLTRALTHRSYVNEHPETPQDNERLEYLGDAVLDFIASAWLYQKYPEMHEGDLTRMRSALVRNEQLALFAQQIELGRAVRLGRGERCGGGSRRSGILGSTFEALMGAVFLHAGLDAVRDFVLPMFDAVADDVFLQPNEFDYKSRLQEHTQSQGRGIPQYRKVSQSGPDHARIFEVEVYIGDTVLGRGSGGSLQAAMQAAAQDALNRLDGLS
jgi:ribonuclease III